MMPAGDALPHQAKGAAEPDVSLRREIRDARGRLLRLATEEQATALVDGHAGTWHGYGTKRHVRLNIDLGHSDSRCTLIGHVATLHGGGKLGGNVGVLYRHSQMCRHWGTPDEER